MDKVKQFNQDQEAYLTLIGGRGVNNFNGARIVEDLKANPGLWERVIPLFSAGGIEFKQRELLEGEPYIDTLYILPVAQEDGSIDLRVKRALSELARKWGADEINWITGRAHINSPEREYLSLWFD